MKPISTLKTLNRVGGGAVHPLYVYPSAKKGMVFVSWLDNITTNIKEDNPSVIAWIKESTLMDGAFFKDYIENKHFLPFINKLISEKTDVQYEVGKILKGISLNTEGRGGNWVPLIDLRALSMMELSSINRSPSPSDILGMFYLKNGQIDFSSYSPLTSYRCISPSGPISMKKDLVLSFIKYLQ